LTRVGNDGLRARLSDALTGWLDPLCRTRAPSRPIAVIGHRGAPREEAENTVDSFSRAISLGADAIETDVCATRDGRFVLWHDADPDGGIALARQAGAEGLRYRPQAPPLGSSWRRPARELDLADLLKHYAYTQSEGNSDVAEARAGARKPIQTIEDLTKWASGEDRLRRVFLDMKLTERETAGALALFDRVRNLAERADLRHVVFHLLSRERELLLALAAEERRNDLPERVRISADFELPGALRHAPHLGVRDVSLGCGERLWRGYRRELCRILRARDRKGFPSYVAAWTVNEERRLRALVRLGADGVVTDDVAALRRIVAGRDGAGVGSRIPALPA
jgi:glycerophosphoryl diester phosphodiesterase